MLACLGHFALGTVGQAGVPALYFWAQGGAEMMATWLPGPHAPSLSLQVSPWLTVPPGSCPWFPDDCHPPLGRALNPKTPGSDFSPPLEALSSRWRCVLTSCHPCRALGPQGGWSSFSRRGVTLPAPARVDVSLRAHTLALKHHACASTTTQTLQVTYPSWGSGACWAPWPSLSQTGRMELRQGPRLHNLRAPVP